MRDALRDAFSAGYRASGAPCITEAAINDAFSDWYQRSIDTLDRAQPAPICPDNSHDYRVDDSDGLLKCITCKKVLF